VLTPGAAAGCTAGSTPPEQFILVRPDGATGPIKAGEQMLWISVQVGPPPAPPLAALLPTLVSSSALAGPLRSRPGCCCAPHNYLQTSRYCHVVLDAGLSKVQCDLESPASASRFDFTGGPSRGSFTALGALPGALLAVLE
jgi:hypothetical protein